MGEKREVGREREEGREETEEGREEKGERREEGKKGGTETRRGEVKRKIFDIFYRKSWQKENKVVILQCERVSDTLKAKWIAGWSSGSSLGS